MMRGTWEISEAGMSLNRKRKEHTGNEVCLSNNDLVYTSDRDERQYTLK